ncbi:hypothetical protein Fcan01_22097 [Folsomia candida]|uniref:Ionotropic glutamate receptor C-terminal domain-containing protein n=1 Tax=Folsomia candida TaxID=158441 RepID=A0A226DCD4_FOLCA|nr:hypothetical protein Fcan01_22097 [Folsomia candida]
MATFILSILTAGLIPISFCAGSTVSSLVPANYGTFSQPSVNQIISSFIPCTMHIMHHNLDSVSLELNYPTGPVLLSILPPSLTLLTEYQTQQNRTVSHFYSRYYTRHRKFCYFYIFYSNPPWDTVSLGLLMRLHILQVHEQVKRGQRELEKWDTNQVGYLYAIFATTEPQNYFQEVQKSYRSWHFAHVNSNVLLLAVIPNFGLLFLSDTSERDILCVSAPQVSYPIQKLLVCHSQPPQAFVRYFGLSHLQQNQFRLARDFSDLQGNILVSRDVSKISNAALFILLEILAPASNISIISNCWNTNEEKCSLPIINEGETSGDWSIFHWSSTYVIVAEKDLHFLTCHSKNRQSLDLYIKPLDLSTWICLVGAMLILVGALRSFVSMVSLSSERRNPGLQSLCFWALGTLLEQLKPFSGRPANFSGFRLLVGIWVVAISVIINGYKSFVIMSLNVPDVLVYPDSYDDISCQMPKFTDAGINLKFQHVVELIAMLPFHENGTELRKNLIMKSSCYSVLSAPIQSPQFDYLSSLSYSFFRDMQILVGSANEKGFKSRKDKIIKDVIDPRHRSFPLKFIPLLDITTPEISIAQIGPAIHAELLLCQKSVYVGSKEDAEALKYNFERRHPSTPKFHVSREKFHVASIGWRFETVSHHRVVKNFKRLLESGIYYLLHGYANFNHANKEINGSEVETVIEEPASGRVDLDGRFQTIFFLWVGGTILAAISEGFELVWRSISKRI